MIMKFLYRFSGVLFFLQFVAVVTEGRSFKNKDLAGSNICTRLEKYEEKRVVPRTYIVRETYTKLCVAIPPVCTYTRLKVMKKNETITIDKTRTVYDCCKGYEKHNKSCVPVCPSGCDHGECAEPNVCLCEEGWRGESCSQQCELNRYGRNCMENCTCQHGAACDRKTGFCNCIPGYTGTFCEFPCPEGTYGFACKFLCNCENGGICDIKDGFCECQPGYYGDSCEQRCEDGHHGPNCEMDCICVTFSTEKCSHIDGKCFCKPGYIGEYCENQCSNFTYGLNCEKNCSCENADFCDPIEGECFCDAGWVGETCTEQCPEGYFGYGCNDKCKPCDSENATCNPVTGHCECPPGSFGQYCEIACPETQWGTDCSESCDCSNNSTCEAITGECICPEGWTGSYCNDSCPTGKFGFDCSSDCLCDKTCNAVTGKCIESEASHLLTSGGNVLSKVIIGFSSLILIFGVFACVCGSKHLAPSIRTWWNSRFGGNNGTSTENIVVATGFNNPIYDSVEGADNSERSGTERSVSFIDITSTIRERLSALSTAESPRASSCETMADQDQASSLRRASKVSNLSAVGSTGKSGRHSKTSHHESISDIDEEFIPENISDFNTPENIIGDVSDISAIKNEVNKAD